MNNTNIMHEALNILEMLHQKGELKFSDVKNTALELGFQLVEYGDCLCPEAHNNAESYAFWNVSGNRNDASAITVYYDFDVEDEKGIKNRAGTVREIYIDRKTAGADLFDRLLNGKELNASESMQAAKLSGLTISTDVYNSIRNRICAIRLLDGIDGKQLSIRHYGQRKLSRKVWNLFEEMKRRVTA